MIETTEESDSSQKDTPLKRYFKYMLVNRKMSVQFTSKKIKEIIENELNIPLELYSVSSKMCIDAFAFYMQCWPEWQEAVKSCYTDELFESLTSFLKLKLNTLKNCKNIPPLVNKKTNYLPLPDYLLSEINADNPSNNRISLQINIPEKLWNKTEVSFKTGDNNDLMLEIQQIKKSTVDISNLDIINHPFISIEFNVPGLIHIQRSSPFKVDRYLHNYKLFPTIETELIQSIEQKHPVPQPKIYTQRVLTSFFNKLKSVLETNYSTAVDLPKRREILTLCDHFLSDIFEANICNATVCEGYVIDFNMSRRSYYINNVVVFADKSSDNMLVYKKILIPIISYCLKSCSLLQEDITKDGYTYFKFMEDIDKTFEGAFLHYIVNSMTYKCTLCDVYYNLHELKQHLMENHPLHSEYQCAKCFKSLPIKHLLQQRWSHECNVILSSIIS